MDRTQYTFNHKASTLAWCDTSLRNFRWPGIGDSLVLFDFETSDLLEEYVRGGDLAAKDDFVNLQNELRDGNFEPKQEVMLTWPAKQIDPFTGEWM